MLLEEAPSYYTGVYVNGMTQGGLLASWEELATTERPNTYLSVVTSSHISDLLRGNRGLEIKCSHVAKNLIIVQ